MYTHYSQVLEELKFVNLPFEHRPLLMTPNSELTLKTNRDASVGVSYAVQALQGFSCPQLTPDCVSQSGGRAAVSVDGSGVVRATDVVGQAVILVSVREAFGMIQTLSLPVEVSIF
jgi:hypothetical protein